VLAALGPDWDATIKKVRRDLAAQGLSDPFDGAIYVFRAKRADRLKLSFWDGTGVCLLAKRLEENAFCWPKIEDGVMRLTSAQLSALLEGLDWKRVRPAKDVSAPLLPC
jgi:transposase